LFPALKEECGATFSAARREGEGKGGAGCLFFPTKKERGRKFDASQIIGKAAIGKKNAQSVAYFEAGGKGGRKRHGPSQTPFQLSLVWP